MPDGYAASKRAFMGPDVHANRPSASLMGVGTLYACTTHNTLERLQADGTWQDWFVPPAGGQVDLSGYQQKTEKGQPNGYAALDGTGVVPDAQLPAGITRDSEMTAALASYQPTSAKGQPNGYASLDQGGKIPVAQVPDLSSTYQVVSQKDQPSGYVGLDASSRIVLGGDTYLYRVAAGSLQTDGLLTARVATDAAGLATKRTADTGWRWYASSDGKQWWGDASGSYDTNLYRATVGVLKTDGSLRTGSVVQANQGTGNDVIVGYITDHPGRGISFINDTQTAWDTNLYRSAVNTLRTDGVFQLNGVSMYRSDPGGLVTLRTDSFVNAPGIAMRYGLDKQIVSGVLNVTNSFHRISAADSTCLVINGTSIDGSLLILQNIAGYTINFTTGSNIDKAFSLGTGGTVIFYNNGIVNRWTPLYY